jgi:hypothetical protein
MRDGRGRAPGLAKAAAPVTRYLRFTDKPQRRPFSRSENGTMRRNVMWSTSSPVQSTLSNTEFLRHHARRLLRHARSDESSASLPVIRRLLASGVMKTAKLADLHEARATLQLKHVLNMLAVELGHPGWDVCKSLIDAEGPQAIDRYRFDAGEFGDYEKNWFASEAAAREWQRGNGGYIVGYGDQAVAILWREVP